MPNLASTRSSSKIAPVNGFPGENNLRDLQFKLTHNLQSTLDLQATLELFFNNIQDAVNVSGLEFVPPNSHKKIALGKIHQHSACYNLTVDSHTIGAITFRRGKRFLEAELAVLEMLLGVLYFPLRNALLYQQALENSLRDPLTGIGNRAALDSSFHREIKLAQRHNIPLSLVILDIDHFKKINDDYGHRTGDRVLKHVVQSIHSTLRETDQIFRFGGEEFVILLNNTPKLSAKLTAERIRVQCAMHPFVKDDVEISPTISLGVSTLKNNDSVETLFERADRGVYKAKAQGRNRVVCLD